MLTHLHATGAVEVESQGSYVYSGNERTKPYRTRRTSPTSHRHIAPFAVAVRRHRLSGKNSIRDVRAAWDSGPWNSAMNTADRRDNARQTPTRPLSSAAAIKSPLGEYPTLLIGAFICSSQVSVPVEELRMETEQSREAVATARPPGAKAAEEMMSLCPSMAMISLQVRES